MKTKWLTYMMLKNVSLMSDINSFTQLKRGYKVFSCSAKYSLRSTSFVRQRRTRNDNDRYLVVQDTVVHCHKN